MLSMEMLASSSDLPDLCDIILELRADGLDFSSFSDTWSILVPSSWILVSMWFFRISWSSTEELEPLPEPLDGVELLLA